METLALGSPGMGQKQVGLGRDGLRSSKQGGCCVSFQYRLFSRLVHTHDVTVGDSEWWRGGPDVSEKLGHPGRADLTLEYSTSLNLPLRPGRLTAAKTPQSVSLSAGERAQEKTCIPEQRLNCLSNIGSS